MTRNISKINKDLILHISFLFLGLVINLLILRSVSVSFSPEDFSKLAYYLVISSLIVSISDYGTKFSYFRKDSTISWENISFFKLYLSIIFFTLVSFIFGIPFFEYLFFLVGYSFFPNVLCQEKSKFYLISGSIFFSRIISFIYIPFSKNVFDIILVQGVIMLMCGLVIFFLNYNRHEIILNPISYFNIIKKNKKIGVYNILSNVEANVHTVLSDLILKSNSFTSYMYADKLSNYFKQILIIFIDFLYPKGEKVSYKVYIYFINLLVLFSGFLIYNTEIVEIVFGFEPYDEFYELILLFLINILAITNFHFEVYNKTILKGFDRENIIIIVSSLAFKILTILIFVNYVGAYVIPAVLILTEILMGLIKKKLIK